MELFRMKRKRGDFCCLNFTGDSVAFVCGKIADNNQPPIIRESKFFPNVLKGDNGHSTSQFLKDIAQEYKVANASCICVLPTSYYRLLLLDSPVNVPKEEITSALPWIVKDLIDFPIDNAVIDAFPVISRPGQPEKIYVVITYRDALEKLQRQIVSAGFNLVCIDIAELVLSYLLARLTPEQDNLALLALTDSYRGIVVNYGKDLCFARDIEEDLSASEKENDTLPFNEIIEEIQRSLDYSQIQMYRTHPVEVLYVPMEGDKQITLDQLKTSISNPIKSLDLSELFSFEKSVEKEQLPHCLFALGGALRAEEF